MAIAASAIKGLDKVLKNLRRKTKEMGDGCQRGVREASLLLLRESQQLVPIDFGLLRASGFANVVGEGFAARGSVGYSASYALYVHEAVGMVLQGQPRPGGRGRYWDPQGRAQAKFLEEPMRRLAPRLRNIIRQNMRIK